jgi:hypothetical protein
LAVAINSYRRRKRLHITINGEAVAEIDIKASYLTIYHARLGVPLENHVDPYERAGVERSIAKSWMIHSFGNVCRQSISDSWLGNLRECLAHLV